jgi:hypothetical protein
MRPLSTFGPSGFALTRGFVCAKCTGKGRGRVGTRGAVTGPLEQPYGPPVTDPERLRDLCRRPTVITESAHLLDTLSLGHARSSPP